MIVLAAAILLCAVLPFALSFVADTIMLVVRRSRAGLPALVSVVALTLASAGAGLLLLYLGQAVDTAPAEWERAVSLGRGLLLVCVPLAVTGMLLRLWIAALPRRRRDPEA
jgi:hypothetical protein